MKVLHYRTGFVLPCYIIVIFFKIVLHFFIIRCIVANYCFVILFKLPGYLNHH